MAEVRKCLCALVLVGVCLSAELPPNRRKVVVVLNPGYPETQPPGGDLMYVRSEGNNDTLHFLFSSQGAPTLLLIHCNDTSSQLQVNWTQYLEGNSSGGLWAEPESSVTLRQALVFSRLLEYDDVNDTATPTVTFPPYDLQTLAWDRLNLSGPSPNILLCGPLAGGSLCLQLTVFDSEGRGQDWPRLLHSDSSAQLEVWLEGITTHSSHSRFLLELQAVGGVTTLSRLDDVRFINDEFTPSIFKVSQWVSSDEDVFVQWKPVCYRGRRPSLDVSSGCGHSSPRVVSVASSLLVVSVFASPSSRGLNISFGQRGEPFYQNSSFTSWTLLMGAGAPLMDSFSLMIISIMAVAMGTPVLLLLVGGAYTCSQRLGGAPPTYQPIN